MSLVEEQTAKMKYAICGTQLLLLQEHSALENPSFKWEYNIKMDLKI